MPESEFFRRDVFEFDGPEGIVWFGGVFDEEEFFGIIPFGLKGELPEGDFLSFFGVVFFSED